MEEHSHNVDLQVQEYWKLPDYAKASMEGTMYSSPSRLQFDEHVALCYVYEKLTDSAIDSLAHKEYIEALKVMPAYIKDIRSEDVVMAKSTIAQYLLIRDYRPETIVNLLGNVPHTALIKPENIRLAQQMSLEGGTRKLGARQAELQALDGDETAFLTLYPGTILNEEAFGRLTTKGKQSYCDFIRDNVTSHNVEEHKLVCQARWQWVSPQEAQARIDMGWMSGAQAINRAAAHMSQTELCTSCSLNRPDEEDACWEQADMDEEMASVLNTLQNLMHKRRVDDTAAELREQGVPVPPIRDSEPELIDETLCRVVLSQLDEELGDCAERKKRQEELNSCILGQQWYVPA